MSDWTTLDELPAGTLFETVDGVMALKTKYNRCYFVGTGERFSLLKSDGDMEVRAIKMPPSSETTAIEYYLGSERPDMLNRPCTLAVTTGSNRFGTVVSTDDLGIWFRGKMERDNPKEKERTYFVPWTSVVWLEMEES